MGTQLPPKRGTVPALIFGPCPLWPNGWMDKDATRYGGRPRPRRLCVRWGPSPSPKRGRSHPPQFSAHICCGQMAAWIKMSLGMEVDLGPGDFVLDGDPAPHPKRGTDPSIFSPYLLRPNGCMDQDVTWYGARPRPRRLCVRWGPRSPFPNFWPVYTVAKWLDGSRCHLAWR